MFTTEYDKIYQNRESASNALSPIDKLFGAKIQQIRNSKFIRKYTNPDLFHLDKSIGIVPINSYIDSNGRVYQIFI